MATSSYQVPQDSVKRVRITISAKEIEVPKDPALPVHAYPKTATKASKRKYPKTHAPAPATGIQKQPKTDIESRDPANAREDIRIRPSDKKPPAPVTKKPWVSPKWLLAGNVLLFIGLIGSFILYRKKRTADDGMLRQLDTLAERADKFEKLSNFKSKLFAIVGHDLRSPIGNLRAMMDLFQNKGMSENEIADVLREILPSVENADLIICNLLNWAVNQMNGLKLNKTDFSFNTVVEETVSSFTFLLESKQICINNNTYVEPFVFADIDLVRIIIRNMVSNAVKFSLAGGQIKFQSSAKDDKVILSVTDNGIGISEKEIKDLFVPQSHFTKSGTKGEKGAGIGLMLCQELAVLNGGTISASSIPGQYCTFSLELPRSALR